MVFVTAHGGSDARIESLAAGADDYLTKPFDEGELRARIGNLLRARAQERALARINQRMENETHDAYKARLLESMLENPSDHFGRMIVVRTQHDREEAAFDLWQTTKMMRECEIAARWPRNPGSCFQWHRACEYYDVCTGCGSIDSNLHFRTAPTEHEELTK